MAPYCNPGLDFTEIDPIYKIKLLRRVIDECSAAAIKQLNSHIFSDETDTSDDKNEEYTEQDKFDIEQEKLYLDLAKLSTKQFNKVLLPNQDCRNICSRKIDYNSVCDTGNIIVCSDDTVWADLEKSASTITWKIKMKFDKFQPKTNEPKRENESKFIGIGPKFIGVGVFKADEINKIEIICGITPLDHNSLQFNTSFAKIRAGAQDRLVKQAAPVSQNDFSDKDEIQVQLHKRNRKVNFFMNNVRCATFSSLSGNTPVNIDNFDALRLVVGLNNPGDVVEIVHSQD